MELFYKGIIYWLFKESDYNVNGFLILIDLNVYPFFLRDNIDK